MSLESAQTLLTLYRRTLSIESRKRVGYLRESIIRLLDLPLDLLDGVVGGDRQLPPPRLRSQIGGSSSRRNFLQTGKRAAAEILRAIEGHVRPGERSTRWLDFGCGSGRVARHLLRAVEIDMTGIDVDRPAIDWCARHLRGSYVAIGKEPPTPLPEASFDVAFSVSVFTHFDELLQRSWLAELRRLVRPGGLLVASTHSETLSYDRPDLSKAEYESLQSHGFAFRGGAGPFNSGIAFHTREYLRREWSRYFTPVELIPAGLLGRLDLSVWRV